MLANRMLAFANPLGMYLRDFNTELLQFEDGDLPASWVRWSRGQKGSFQRLELGPGDDDAVFLDDISLHVGQEPEPLEGGYQLIKEMEVGPLIATAPTSPPSEGEFLVIPAGVPIDCRTTGVCEDVNTLKAEHAQATAPKPAPRRPPGA